MNELAEVSPTWQTDTAKCAASVLFSDIGSDFYSKLGWHAYPSHTIEFEPSLGMLTSYATPIYAKDLQQICDEDQMLAREAMSTQSPFGKTRYMIVPDYEHMLWHHCKEEFAAETLFQKIPQVKGETASTANTLYILRLVIENQFESENYSQVEGLRAVILAAQAEAAEWGLHLVKLWGPSTQVQELISRTGIHYVEEHRDEDGICSLRWYGEGSGTANEVEWIGNEKYGWC
ncbi:hypothetical protein BJX99DRAFT_252766 [Aspergillus californicus]